MFGHIACAPGLWRRAQCALRQLCAVGAHTARDLPSLLLSAALLAGCANAIVVPERRGGDSTIYLLDLGRHSRLAFECPDGGLVEYAYGEWRWYARMEDAYWRLPAVLLWPTQGTLGRRHWKGPNAEARLRSAYGNLTLFELPADGRKAAALARRLDRAFERRSDRRVHNRVYGLEFVPLGRDYWLFHNSNHAVRDWLRAAGFEVRGSGIVAQWRVVE